MIKFYALKKILNFIPNLQYSTCLVPGMGNKTVDLAYTSFGEGTAPPLIIHHALFGAKNNWRRICLILKDKLDPKRKIIAIDARNHGASPHTPEHTYQHLASDLQVFLKRHKIEKAALLGHSMGGRAIMYLALKHHDLVERAIVVDVSPINMPRNLAEYKTILGAMKRVKVPHALSLPDGRIEAKEQMKDKIDSDYVLNFIVQNLKKDKTGRFTWSLNVDALYNFLDHITVFPKYILQNRFPNKVLFIAGRRSNFIDQNDWPAIQETFPNSRLVWVDSGHLVHIEQPEQTVKLIANFLNK